MYLAIRMIFHPRYAFEHPQETHIHGNTQIHVEILSKQTLKHLRKNTCIRTFAISNLQSVTLKLSVRGQLIHEGCVMLEGCLFRDARGRSESRCQGDQREEAENC